MGGWRWPRNVAHIHCASDVPTDLPPTTKETLIAHVTAAPGSNPARPTIKPEVLGFLELAHKTTVGSSSKSLVHEFEYDLEECTVHYDVGQQEGIGNGYA